MPMPLPMPLAGALPGALPGALQAASAAGGPGAVGAPTLATIGPVGSAQTVQFDVILPLSNPSGLDALLQQQQDPNSPQYHKWLKPTDFAARFGPSPVAVTAVANVLRMLGLQVTPQSRSLHVVGTAAQVNSAFSISLAMAATRTGQATMVAGLKPTLPPGMASYGAILSAFSPTAFQSGLFVHSSSHGYVGTGAQGYFHSSAHGYGQAGAAPIAGYFYNDLKQAYGYPSYQTMTGKVRVDGTGATVAVVMASDVQDSDVAALFGNMGFVANSGQAKMPAVYARRPVNGGAAFSAANPAAEEATADVEQVLGGAPGSNVVLYDTPDLSDQSLISAYTAIDNDNVADVVSLSLGQCELDYTAAYNGGVDGTAVLSVFSQLFKQGNAQGITFVAASGDGGGLGCPNPSYLAGGGGQFVAGVSVPAADPNVTGVGGTNLVTAADEGGTDSSYVGENAWSDPEVAFDPDGLGVTASGGIWGSGGGVSTLYPQPAYQALVPTGSSSWRAVPDVAMQMGGCPDVAVSPCDGGKSAFDGAGNTDRSSLNIVFNGQLDNVVGTSVAAPEFASVVALLVELQGRQGNINPMLYAAAQSQATGGAGYFHNAVAGWDGLLSNAAGYNDMTGLGTPVVAALIGLPNAALAGPPQSASNP